LVALLRAAIGEGESQRRADAAHRGDAMTAVDKWTGVTKPRWQRQIAKTDPFKASAEERREFYRLILGILWLAPEVRNGVRKALGLSAAAYKKISKPHWALMASLRIEAHIERMKENGESGDLWERAVEVCAAEERISPDAYKKRLATWPLPAWVKRHRPAPPPPPT
jgi:hypothetical protein